MDDREEITALVHRYADLLDGGDLDGVVELFAAATWRSAATGQVLRGPDAIRRVQKPNPGGFLERDGNNLPSVMETARESDAWVIERVGRYLSAISESVELLGVVAYGEYETVRFRVARDGQPLEFDAANMSDGTLRTLAALVAAFQIVLPSLTLICS